MDAAKQRQTKIQIGVVNRILKDKTYYEKDVEQIKIKIAQMKDSNEDTTLIRHQEAVLIETRSMLPDTHRRLKMAVEQLEKMIENENPSEDIVKTALETLESAKQALEI